MKTIDKTVKILDALVSTGGARVSELSDLLDIPNSTVHSHLESLKDHGLVHAEGDINRIGLKFLYYSGSILYTDDIYSLIEPKVTFLARKSGERAQFITEQRGRGVYLFTETIGETAVQTDVRPGKFVDLHATAAGKAILAHLSKERVNEIVSRHGLASCTPQTVTNRTDLHEELSTVREQGYSTNDEERISQQRAVGVPVLNIVGEPIGAFSISGPAHRIEHEDVQDRIAALLLGTADEVELNIQYH